METKKYFIGCTFEDESVNEMIKQTTADLASNFGIQDVSKKHTPHLTNKVPFLATVDQIEVVKEYVTAYMNHLQSMILNFGGYGHFSNNAIFLDVSPNINLLTYIVFQKNLAEGLYEKFNSWMHFDKNEPLSLPHVTLAKNDIEIKTEQLLSYLNKNHLEFLFASTTLLDLVIFEKSTTGEWVPYFSQPFKHS